MRSSRVTSSRITNALIVFILGMVLLIACRPAYLSQREGDSGQCRPGPVRGFLHSLHGELVDASGCGVVLTGVNWFGFETSAFAPHGLAVRNWKEMLTQIKGMGFKHHSPALHQSALRPVEPAPRDQLQAEPGLEGSQRTSTHGPVYSGGPEPWSED